MRQLALFLSIHMILLAGAVTLVVLGSVFARSYQSQDTEYTPGFLILKVHKITENLKTHDVIYHNDADQEKKRFHASENTIKQ